MTTENKFVLKTGLLALKGIERVATPLDAESTFAIWHLASLNNNPCRVRLYKSQEAMERDFQKFSQTGFEDHISGEHDLLLDYSIINESLVHPFAVSLLPLEDHIFGLITNTGKEATEIEVTFRYSPIDQVSVALNTDLQKFLNMIRRPGVKITEFENQGSNKHTRRGNYLRVSVGLNSKAFFVGQDLVNQRFVVEWLGQ